MKLIDRTGMRFGRLVVLRKDDAPRMWVCQCDCGAQVLATGSNLSKGGTKSCGCLALEWAASMGGNPEFIRKRADGQVRHGHKRRSGKTVEYATWLSIKRRCHDPKSKDYPSWGGRGITVCEAWRDSFDAFLADMGPRPDDKESIDRKDGSRGYEPGNCRWATSAEQGQTKTNNIRVSFAGVEYHSLKEACAALGLRYTTVFERVRSGGYSPEDALSFGSERPHVNIPPARS